MTTNHEYHITLKWYVEDVHRVRPDLDDRQAREVLRYIRDNHSADVGVNWYVIECAASDLFPTKDDE
jgi:hypothetical protein